MKRGWKAICDRCGFEYHSYELQQEWNGLMVCKSCREPRHPQDFVRATPDRPAPPWTRPEPDDVFGPSCTPITIQAIPDVGTAGCMIAEYINLSVFECTLSGSRAIAQYAIAGCALAGNINFIAFPGASPVVELIDLVYLVDEFGNFLVDEFGNFILA